MEEGVIGIVDDAIHNGLRDGPVVLRVGIDFLGSYCVQSIMNKRRSLSAINDELADVRTKKKEFLSQVERIDPWGEWLTLIRTHYYKGERGNKPYDLERMLRIYLIQNLYNLADEATVAEVIDSRAFRIFVA